MKPITEEMKEQDKWYEETNEMTLEKLSKFLEHLTKDYLHDYGTICHAVAAGGIATMRAIDNENCGGITGFQAGCVMWQFIDKWMGFKDPMKLVKYNDMLYPQFQDKFDKVISKDTWKYLQKEANKNLKYPDPKRAHPNVIKHWKSIASGAVPFGYKVSED